MIDLIGHWLLDWFLGWAGLSVLVALCAGAVWWFIPPIFTHVRAIAFNVALGALAFNFVFTMGFTDGASSTKAANDAAEQRQRDRGEAAHERAEQDTEPAVEVAEPVPACPPQPGSVSRTPRPRPMPRWLRDDPYRRDDR